MRTLRVQRRGIRVRNEAFAAAVLIVKIALEHRGPTWLERQIALDVGRIDDLDRLLIDTAYDRRLNPR